MVKHKLEVETCETLNMHRGKKKEKPNQKIWLLEIFLVVSNIASLLLNKISPEVGDENQRNDCSRQKRHK